MIIRGSNRTVFEVIRDTPELSQVYDFFEAAGALEDLLPQGQTITVFAPSNTAVEALDITAPYVLAQTYQQIDASYNFSNSVETVTQKIILQKYAPR